jgi:hypothetical protein
LSDLWSPRIARRSHEEAGVDLESRDIRARSVKITKPSKNLGPEALQRFRRLATLFELSQVRKINSADQRLSYSSWPHHAK